MRIKQSLTTLKLQINGLTCFLKMIAGLICFVQICSSTSAQNYCYFNVYGSQCSPADNIDLVSITGTTLNVSGAFCYNQPGYNITIFPDTGAATCNLFQGQTYQLNVRSTSTGSIAAWIDYNQNFIFDSTEFISISGNNMSNSISTVNFTIPMNTNFGKTGMRIRSANTHILPTDACTSFYTGESEDYTVFIAAMGICSSLPSNILTYSAQGNNVCKGTNVIFSLAGLTPSGGLQYEWQSSLDSLTWNTIPGGNQRTDTIVFQVDSYFRCKLVCGVQLQYSTPIKISSNFFFNCYCSSQPTYPIIWNTYSHIGNVRLSNLNIGADSVHYVSPNNYGHYTNNKNLGVAQLIQSSMYSLRVVLVSNYGGTFQNCLLNGFIDFNQDGDFDDPYEKIMDETSVGGRYIVQKNIQVPLTAMTGITGMRIIAHNSRFYKNGGCFSYDSGETEDYLVDIRAGQICQSNLNLIETKTNQGEFVCEGTATKFSLSILVPGYGQKYIWQKSIDSVQWYVIPNATYEYLFDTINAAFFYRCLIICGNDTNFSVPLHMQVLPNNLCYCNNLSSNSYYSGTDIGKFRFGQIANGIDSIPVLRNTNGIHFYSNFYNQGIYHFEIGKTYPAVVSQISSDYLFRASTANLFIDYNRNGTFDVQESILLGQSIDTLLGSKISAIVQISQSASPGTTGLRIVLNEGGASNMSCNQYNRGETEDYLIQLDLPTSIQNFTQNEEISIYPNPCNDLLSISRQTSKKDRISLKLYSISGINLLQSLINEGQKEIKWDLSTLDNGFYLLDIFSNEEHLGNRKIAIIK